MRSWRKAAATAMDLTTRTQLADRLRRNLGIPLNDIVFFFYVRISLQQWTMHGLHDGVLHQHLRHRADAVLWDLQELAVETAPGHGGAEGARAAPGAGTYVRTYLKQTYERTNVCAYVRTYVR